MAIAPTTEPTTASEPTIRLHITPLTPSTLSLIPASLLTPTARDSLSFHTLPTFPESPYAFLTLPVTAADALKKKLHGSTFRGVKVRIEEARPVTAIMPAEAEKTKKELRAERREKRKRDEAEPKTKKRKKGETKDVLEGVQLPEGRKVARGWTKTAEPSSAGKKYAGKAAASGAKKSEEDSKRECLFKTPLPPNKAATKDEKKKDKEDKKDKKQRKREVVVKEFNNNTKFPQFLKGSQLGQKEADGMASEYVDGVGWVNGRGEVVEEEKIKRRAADIVQIEVRGPAKAPEPRQKQEDVQSTVSFEDEDEAMVDVDEKKAAIAAYASDDSSSEAESDAESEAESEPPTKTKTKTSTPTPSDSESSDAESTSNPPSDPASPASPLPTKPKTTILPLTPITPIHPARTSPKTATPTLQITIPTLPSPPAVQIHPLEALYKPTTATTTTTLQPDSTSPEPSTFKFGFGGNSNDDDDATPTVATPYRERYRSAAPTPDTAIGHRRFFPDESEESIHGRLGFVPSTPRVVGAGESPLLFPHAESRFLGALSVWSRLPTPKAFTAQEATVEEEGEEEAARKEKKEKKKGKKGKKVEEEEEVREKTPSEVWSETFYEKRGEWNRAWKGRRREVLKAKRKREAAAGGKKVAA